MDKLIRHWASQRRLFPSPLPIQSIGHAVNKTVYLRRSFPTLNFSIILRGGGEYCLDGKRWAVKAPCILIQFPDTHCEYGPTAPFPSWEEIYLIYAAGALPLFQSMQIVDRERPVWPIHSEDWLDQVLAEINRQLARRGNRGLADWLDRPLQAFLLETLLSLEPIEQTRPERALQQAAARIEENLMMPVDWNRIAGENGMSLPTLRRQWKRLFNAPAATWLTQQRIREAKRLLVESNKTVGEIAPKVGIEDPLYFSRLFSKSTGQSPTTYRQTYRVRWSGRVQSGSM